MSDPGAPAALDSSSWHSALIAGLILLCLGMIGVAGMAAWKWRKHQKERKEKAQARRDLERGSKERGSIKRQGDQAVQGRNGERKTPLGSEDVMYPRRPLTNETVTRPLLRGSDSTHGPTPSKSTEAFAAFCYGPNAGKRSGSEVGWDRRSSVVAPSRQSALSLRTTHTNAKSCAAPSIASPVSSKFDDGASRISRALLESPVVGALLTEAFEGYGASDDRRRVEPHSADASSAGQELNRTEARKSFDWSKCAFKEVEEEAMWLPSDSRSNSHARSISESTLTFSTPSIALPQRPCKCQAAPSSSRSDQQQFGLSPYANSIASNATSSRVSMLSSSVSPNPTSDWLLGPSVVAQCAHCNDGHDPARQMECPAPIPSLFARAPYAPQEDMNVNTFGPPVLPPLTAIASTSCLASQTAQEHPLLVQRPQSAVDLSSRIYTSASQTVLDPLLSNNNSNCSTEALRRAGAAAIRSGSSTSSLRAGSLRSLELTPRTNSFRSARQPKRTSITPVPEPSYPPSTSRATSRGRHAGGSGGGGGKSSNTSNSSRRQTPKSRRPSSTSNASVYTCEPITSSEIEQRIAPLVRRPMTASAALASGPIVTFGWTVNPLTQA